MNIDKYFEIEKPVFKWELFWRYFMIALGVLGIGVSALLWYLEQATLIKVIVVWLATLLAAVFFGFFPYIINNFKAYRTKAQRYEKLFQFGSSRISDNDKLEEDLEKVPRLLYDAKQDGIQEGQKQVLASLLMATIARELNQFEVSAISERDGTVILVVQAGTSSGLVSGMRLEVRTIGANDLWGVIELKEVHEGKSFGAPVDRINPDFWEHLEDRVRRDSAPPQGVVLVPYIMPEIANIMDQLALPKGD